MPFILPACWPLTQLSVIQTVPNKHQCPFVPASLIALQQHRAQQNCQQHKYHSCQTCSSFCPLMNQQSLQLCLPRVDFCRQVLAFLLPSSSSVPLREAKPNREPCLCLSVHNSPCWSLCLQVLHTTPQWKLWYSFVFFLVFFFFLPLSQCSQISVPQKMYRDNCKEK